MKLKVLNIQRFCLHDGPGIRTTVFLAGCPLRCPWCANPESQQSKNQLLYQKNKCVGCQTCVSVCPQKAIRFLNNRWQLDRAQCICCGQCAAHCSSDALRLSYKELSVDEVMTVVLQDKNYYSDSSGGLTVSGGEPFVQFTGLLKLLKQAKENQIHTAIETTGDTKWQNIEAVLPFTDLFLFDLKADSAKAITEMSQGNGERILANLNRLSRLFKEKIILRVPCIPGYNFTSESIETMLGIAVSLGIAEVHLLPYHNLGKGKYEQLGLDYALGDLSMLKKSDLQVYCEFGERLGLKVQAGG
ncbi:MAG: glycyl-radical enzyme activating protein [Erysipelotrichaceae bacterium]|jgi:pyruvate formate lyase activating enzyme|nr:glycyl-radical enzyme activating protein [Erysipelotrichaceae bacterium]